jgi:hypothetical protein
VGFNVMRAQNDTVKMQETTKNDLLIYKKDYYKIKDLTIVIHTITDIKGNFIQRFKMVHQGEYFVNKERYTYDEKGRVRKYEKYGICGTPTYRVIYDENGNKVSERRIPQDCKR